MVVGSKMTLSHVLFALFPISHVFYVCDAVDGDR